MVNLSLIFIVLELFNYKLINLDIFNYLIVALISQKSLSLID